MQNTRELTDQGLEKSDWSISSTSQASSGTQPLFQTLGKVNTSNKNLRAIEFVKIEFCNSESLNALPSPGPAFADYVLDVG